MAEFAQRQVDLLDVLRTQTSPVEREAYGLAEPVGVAIARQDTTEFRLEVRGSAHVYEMDFMTSTYPAEEPLVSARLELALDLPSRVTTQHLTTQTWTGQRVQDPVVEMFSRLHAMAVRFNERQPQRVRLDIEGCERNWLLRMRAISSSLRKFRKRSPSGAGAVIAQRGRCG